MDKIELRSEKVRKIIGDMPSGFLRYGISIITIVLILICMVCCFIPYENKIVEEEFEILLQQFLQ